MVLLKLDLFPIWWLLRLHPPFPRGSLTDTSQISISPSFSSDPGTPGVFLFLFLPFEQKWNLFGTPKMVDFRDHLTLPNFARTTLISSIYLWSRLFTFFFFFFLFTVLPLVLTNVTGYFITQKKKKDRESNQDEQIKEQRESQHIWGMKIWHE